MSDSNERRYDSGTPFSVLLEDATDFDLVNGVFVKIVDKYGLPTEVSDISQEKRNLSLVWHVSGIIGNGGFEYLLSWELPGDPDLTLAAQAHKSVGLTRGYAAFQRMFDAFPNRSVPADPELRIREYKLLDESIREEINTLYWTDSWEKTRETELADYIRLHASTFADLDPKLPEIWNRLWEFVSTDEFVLSMICGILAGFVAWILSPDKASVPFVTTIVAIVGLLLGWLWGRRRRWNRNYPLGANGLETWLDFAGRELLTIWIPLDHDLNDDDVTFAQNLGRAMNEECLGQNELGHCVRNISVATRLNAVGVTIKGWNADDVLRSVRPFFQARCPHGSYVTRLRLYRDDENEDDPALRWDRARPLFEGEDIAER